MDREFSFNITYERYSALKPISHILLLLTSTNECISQTIADVFKILFFSTDSTDSNHLSWMIQVHLSESVRMDLVRHLGLFWLSNSVTLEH